MSRKQTLLLCLMGLLGFASCSHKELQTKHILWYDQATENWSEGLPIGNGRIGAMIYGPALHERLALNENTLYSGEPSVTYTIPNKEKEIQIALNLLRNKEYSKADEYVTRNLLGRIHQCYQPMGDLIFNFGENSDVTSVKSS